MDQYTAILFSLVSAIIMGVPLVIIEKLFSIKYCIFKLFGYAIFTGALLVCMYSSLTIAALMGVSEANQWAFNYFSSFSIDFFMVNPSVNYAKISLYYCSLRSTNFISKLIQKALHG
jgi:hypothetical protein